MAKAISSVTSLTLDLPPSCIALCPTHPRFFAVGTYFLHPSVEKNGDSLAEQPAESFKKKDSAESAIDDEDDDNTGNEDHATADPQPQKRTGSLSLFDLDPETSEVTLLQTLPISSAILDIQWRPITSSISSSSDSPLLATATSTGAVHFHTLSVPTTDEDQAELRHLSSHQLTSTEAELCLYLSWHPTRSGIFGATFNDGSAKVYSVQAHGSSECLSVKHLATLPTHSLEAWVLSFSPTSTSVYTGGDDGILLTSSLPATIPDENSVPDTAQRAEDDADSSATEILPARVTDRKSHQAGVTAILPLPLHSTIASSGRELVLTGSYDDHIRLLSVPSAGQAGRVQVLAELDLGGGVWRLKIRPYLDSSASYHVYSTSEAEQKDNEYIILASCMHAGTRILRLRQEGGEEGEWQFEVLARFEEHKSMNYGSDVQTLIMEGKESKMKIVSTSFYDKLLCVWDVEV